MLFDVFDRAQLFFERWECFGGEVLELGVASCLRHLELFNFIL